MGRRVHLIVMLSILSAVTTWGIYKGTHVSARPGCRIIPQAVLQHVCAVPTNLP
ncbi:MAG: hypothetical protein ABR518_01595 [Actinomycetota bacterium]